MPVIWLLFKAETECSVVVMWYADGVVLVDPDYLKDRKVFSHVLAAFRYGREDLDVLGLAFRKDLFLATQQVFPPPNVDSAKPLTRLQERLIKKLGANAYPFFFEVIHQHAYSVCIQNCSLGYTVSFSSRHYFHNAQFVLNRSKNST